MRLLAAELLKIWAHAKKTVLFITHQINEAVYLADRVIVMSARPGRVKGEFDIPFGRPRGLALKRDPKFLQLEDAIWKLIEEEAGNLGITGELEPADAENDKPGLPKTFTGGALTGEYSYPGPPAKKETEKDD